jgi:hypothetical protein
LSYVVNMTEQAKFVLKYAKINCFMLCENLSRTVRGKRRFIMKISESKREKITGKWCKLHTEELHNFYSLRNIIRMFKSRRMR